MPAAAASARGARYGFPEEPCAMGFVCGIIGMPNVGKSTVFNALTGGEAEVSNYPFCTIQPNRGVAPVPDSRLELLGQRIRPEKLTPTFMEFMDVAGLVEGAHRGEGLGNTFLGHIRAVDALVHVVRAFDADAGATAHVLERVDPVRDIGLIETELVLADLEIVEKRLEKVRRVERLGNKEAIEERALLEMLCERLGKGIMARDIPGSNSGFGLSEEKAKEWGLLTAKPMLYVVNIGEADIPDQEVICSAIRDAIGRGSTVVLPLCAKLEEEVLALPQEEQERFRQELGLLPSGLARLVEAGYKLLNLITFYTIVGKEVRAWTLRNGQTMHEAAGKIHTDMQKGFIRAEVLPFEDFARCGSEQSAREKGLVRVEGKEYVVRDGDIVRIRFQRAPSGG
jgi:GTP-binding protein YchF